MSEAKPRTLESLLALRQEIARRLDGWRVPEYLAAELLALIADERRQAKREERERCARHSEQPGTDVAAFFVRQQIAAELRALPDDDGAQA